MVYEKKFVPFSTDKRKFFSSIRSLDEAKARAQDKHHNYGFVATNEKLIREEFNLLFDRLQKDAVDQDIFWFYCYYCCIMLQNYHQAYGQKGKADEFLKLRKKIRKRCTDDERMFPKDPAYEDSFITYLAKAIGDGLVDLVTTPIHVSKIKDKISLANVYRIYWFFCRTAITKSFLLARELEVIDRIGSVLGKKINVDNIISIIEGPNEVFRALSVGFFAARFIMNAGMLIKHVFFPNNKEKALAWHKRLANEMYKRHADFLNDLVWGTVNLVTNYNQLFHIAAPTASWMVAGFLFFDFCLILWKRHLAEREYLVKRSQLVSDLNHYQAILKQQPNTVGLNEEALRQIIAERTIQEEQCRILTGQIKQLDISWQAKNATYWFNACAALLLMTGFAASMIVSPPVMVLACYMLCTFAVAMYLSDGAYNNYKEKSLLLKQARMENKDTREASAACRQAALAFGMTMGKNVLLPALFIATFAICWQAALVLTAAYLAYQLWSAYSKHAESKAKSKCQPEKVVEEAVEDPIESNLCCAC